MSGLDELDRPLLARFADVLDYPDVGIAAAVEDCRSMLREDVPAAADLLADLAAFAAGRPLGELQELYTAAFDLDTLSDLDPTCYPYVGHHLFGENHERSAFLVGLLERYRAYEFDAPSGELPDHLVVLLRFAAACPDDELVGELLEDAVVPALERMSRDVGPGDGAATGRLVYLRALAALRLALAPEPREPISVDPVEAA